MVTRKEGLPRRSVRFPKLRQRYSKLEICTFVHSYCKDGVGGRCRDSNTGVLSLHHIQVGGGGGGGGSGML
jgi:hypothetical protein